jgi:Tropinone reductase 1
MATVRVRIAILTVRITLSVCLSVRSIVWHILPTAAKEGFGKIKGLVNNVGTDTRKSILEQTEEEYHTMMKTNVNSSYFLCRSFLDLFDEDGATIVKVSLVAGTESSRTGAAYGMSKAAINHFTRILAFEWPAL